VLNPFSLSFDENCVVLGELGVILDILALEGDGDSYAPQA
jgi:hypothetical protein